MFIVGPLGLILAIWIIRNVCCDIFQSKEERWIENIEREKKKRQKQERKDQIRLLMGNKLSLEQQAELNEKRQG
jgi:hypothetical protein